MKKICTVFTLLILTINLLAQQYTTVGNMDFKKQDGVWLQIDRGQEYHVVENRITIKYKPNVSDQEINNFSTTNNLSLYFQDTVVGYFVYLIPENADIIDVLSNLHGHHLTQVVETQTYGVFLTSGYISDYCEDPLIANDVFVPKDNYEIISMEHQWYLPKIGADCAWQIETGNKNVIVALLDTGVDNEHPDIGMGDNNYQNIIEGWNYIENNNITMDYCFINTGCHGTYMAGIIAAKTNNGEGIAGIAGGWSNEGVKILPLINSNNIGQVDPTFTIQAIQYAVSTGAKIINMSFGNAGANYMDATLEWAYKEGVLLIAAAGQILHGQGSAVFYPARHPDVIAVGGTDINDNRPISYNYGINLELSAPGVQIWTTDGGGLSAYKRISGTSASTAIVSGLAALLWSYNPCFKNEEIRYILRATAEKVGNASNYNWNPENPGHSLGFGYGRVNAYEALIMAGEYFSNTYISENTIWSDDEAIRGNLIIETGAMLTIKSTVMFDVNSKIVVETGAKLIVDGGILTNSMNCPAGTWQGIEVWGNRLAHQWPDAQGNLAQGYLELNNATIENAIVAVSLWKPDDYSTTGGIIVADNSVFINNRTSVHAPEYRNYHPVNEGEMDYRATFTRCTFEIDEDYPAAETFYKHVDLSRVKGVNFLACNFLLSPSAPNVSLYNMGIGSYSAGFNATGICTVFGQDTCVLYDPITFSGLNWAINANNPDNSTRTFNVNRAEFNNNTYGIRVSGINNFTVLNSEFNIGYNGPESDPCDSDGKSASGYGIHMTGCTGFAIEENYFTKASGAPTGNYTGILIAETQAADQVYRNTFDGLSYGNYAVGKNWKDTYTWQGLAYYCNENTNNWQDFTVEDVPDKPDGIQNPQGSTQMPAGNTFSTNANNNFNNWDFNNWIGYYYYAPSQGNTSTVYYPQVVNRVTRGEVVGIQNPCLSNYGGGGSGSTRDVVMTPEQKQQAEMEYAAGLSDYNNVKTLYDNLKDGGSTTATMTDIATAWPSDMWELRAGLLGKSPHLSMDVLKAAADRIDVLPESVIFEIMAANPDELKKEELIKYLEDKDNPLPEYMVDILRQVAMGSSYKTVLQRQMAHYGQLKTRAAHNIIRSLLNDTIADNYELRNWLDNIGGKRADEQIIASYMGEGNFTNALALANMMPALYNYTGNELTEHGYYLDMLNLQISLAQQGKTIFDLDSTGINNLVLLAENSRGTAGAQAKGILEYAYGYNYCNCIGVDNSGYKSSNALKPGAFEKMFGVEITVKPNPAKEWAVFNYSLPDSDAEGVIRISDVSGKLIATLTITGKKGQKIWDTREIKSGVYFYTLNVSGFNKSGKIVVSK